VASVLRVSSSLSTSLSAFSASVACACFRRLRHLLTKLGGFCFNALNFIQRFQRLGQILLNQFVLRREFFCLFSVSSCD
jgi:hypothetical protein